MSEGAEVESDILADLKQTIVKYKKKWQAGPYKRIFFKKGRH